MPTSGASRHQGARALPVLLGVLAALPVLLGWVLVRLALLGLALVGLTLVGPPATAAPVAAAPATPRATPTPTPTPTPFPLPAARSWVGGRQLIQTGELVDLPAGVPGPPVPNAAAWLVVDLNTRQVLAGQRVHVPLPTASTMKIFTALALAPTLSPARVYTARADDAAIDGTKVGLVPGSTYTVDNLLHGMLMASGNDCANAIGNLAGGQGAAIAAMHAEALRLGAFDTEPRTTSGLDAPGQVSSAYDLALAGSAALANPQLAAVMRTKAYTFPAAGTGFGKSRHTYQIQSHDRLLRNVLGATGVKNGYTVAARGSFVGSATRGGHSYLAVLLRAEGSTWHQTRDLLEWAFAHGAQARPVGTLIRPGELSAPIGPGLNGQSASGTAGAGGGSAALGSGGGGSRGRPGASGLRSRLGLATADLTVPLLRRPHAKLWLALAAAVLILGTSIGALASRPPAAAELLGGGRHRS